MNITGYNERFQGRDFSQQYLEPHKLHNNKIYRVNIFSKDAISGTYTDGTYFVNLDDIPNPGQYHIVIENMVVFPSSTSGNVTTFMVELLDVNQPNTYSTSIQTNSRIALSTSLEGNIYYTGSVAVTRNWCNYQRNITTNTIGIPLSDTNILKSKQIRIQLKSLADAVLATSSMGSTTSWMMTLLVYPFSP